MTVEAAAFISELVASDPQGSDSISEGDDHLRVCECTAPPPVDPVPPEYNTVSSL